MRVLVTGASGHVGSAVAAHLADAGHEAVGLSRREPTEGDAWVTADIGSAEGIEAVRRAGPFDAVVHAAACLDKRPEATGLVLTDCLGTQRLIELAEGWGAAFVFISGVTVIGRPRTLPIDEEHPVDPSSAYLASKLFGERLVELARRRGATAATLRLSAPVGPGMPEGRILSVFAGRALAGEPLELAGSGSREQDYVDVRDVAVAVEAALERRAQGLFNVASGRPLSNVALARLCVELLGSRSEIRPTGTDDPEEGVRWEVSIERAASVLGYRPACSIEDSVAAVAGRASGVAPGRSAGRPAGSSSGSRAST